MSHGVKNFLWRNGRPRWIPSPQLRAAGAQGKNLQDATGAWLSLWHAMLEAHRINLFHGVREQAPQPPVNEPAVAGEKGYVYFVLVGQHMKIGFSRNASGRASDIAGGGAVPASMIVVLPGSRKDEAALHNLFAADRLQGEWFHATQKINNLVVRSVYAQRITLAIAAPKKAVTAGKSH
jgi:hypothetical protein